MRFRKVLFFVIALLVFACNYREDKVGVLSPEVHPEQSPAASPTPPAIKEWYTSLQKQVFTPKCVECHNPSNAKGDVVLTNYRSVMDADPPIIKPGKPKSSVLYQSIVHLDPDKRMPKGTAPLSESEIQVIYNWIVKGAPETNPDAPNQDQ